MITGIILTKNSERVLVRSLTCLRKFDEIIVYDTGSIDGTLELARSFGVRVEQGEGIKSFAETRNKAAALSSNDFVFFLDSDEFIDWRAYDELAVLFTARSDVVVGFKRLNMYDLKNYVVSWYPDVQFRAYNRKEHEYYRDVDCLLRYKQGQERESTYHLWHNLFLDRKRYEENKIRAGVLAGRVVTPDEARQFVDFNLNRPRKPVLELGAVE